MWKSHDNLQVLGINSNSVGGKGGCIWLALKSAKDRFDTTAASQSFE